MRQDTTTLHDLSVFSGSGSGIFDLINHTTTHAGRDVLKKMILEPPSTYERLRETQDTVRFWAANPEHWPEDISNGTLVMLEKFFEAPDSGSGSPGGIRFIFGSFLFKTLNKTDYFHTQFSLKHLQDFLSGCSKLCALLKKDHIPALLRRELEAMKEGLSLPLADTIRSTSKDTPFKQTDRIIHQARREMKHPVLRMMYHYARIDAWQSMARATSSLRWSFPELLPQTHAHFEAVNLFHPLLKSPKSYDIRFSEGSNFLILTGANMSGKTTFMRALGVSAMLAHLGMGVPAGSMRISFLQGILTNMHVEDNLILGESYFLAEVKRMKHTAEKILHEQPMLVLMDELFKGTNVHDAYECTKAVIDGLLQHNHHLMILSTHLYEAVESFSNIPRIQFASFVTEMTSNNGYRFTYELRPGISNDRIGYSILKTEGVLDLLYGNTPRTSEQQPG